MVVDWPGTSAVVHAPLPKSSVAVGGMAAMTFSKPLLQPPSNSGPTRCPDTLRVRVQQEEACRRGGMLSAPLSLDNFQVTTFR